MIFSKKKRRRRIKGILGAILAVFLISSALCISAFAATVHMPTLPDTNIPDTNIGGAAEGTSPIPNILEDARDALISETPVTPSPNAIDNPSPANDPSMEGETNNRLGSVLGIVIAVVVVLAVIMLLIALIPIGSKRTMRSPDDKTDRFDNNH